MSASPYKNLTYHTQQKLTNYGLISLVIFALSFLYIPSVSALEISLPIIKEIESSGRADAISYRGAHHGVGSYQISDILRREYNNFQGTNYTTTDLFNEVINEKIADWYLHKRIPQLLRHYNLPETTSNILIAYNFGIGNLKNGKPLPNETKNYIKKYKRLGGVL